MKISEFIQELETLKAAFGDLEVTTTYSLDSITTDRREIMNGKPFETTAGVSHVEGTDAFPEPHFRITL